MNQITTKLKPFDVPKLERETLSFSNAKILKEEIKGWLTKREAVLVAHYYTDEEIQILAEETGGIVSDSLEMARFGQECKSKILVVAGVRFMGETAKILNPEKTVLMPNLSADCSLDLGCPADQFNAFCDQHPDRTVVVYANTSAAVKARSDWMVTSGSAVDVVNHLKAQGNKILWAPDKYLGDYVRRKTKADILMWNGSCVVHEEFKSAELHEMRLSMPKALVIAHPESPRGVLDQADYIGSTSGLIDFVRSSKAENIIVATDKGIFHKMAIEAPDKNLISAPTAGEGATCRSCGECPWMAMNDLKALRDSLKELDSEILVPVEIAKKARLPIKRLLEFANSRNQTIYENNDA